MNPRYQVFLSSTFRDLKSERQSALDAILELGHFPAGMEAFPAADETPWDLIRTIIDESDYYILIIGGRYGSTGPAGISYTEMEYELALELRKPILAFIHSAPNEISMDRSELEPAARQSLDAFRERVANRLTKGWKNKDDLKAAVFQALVHAIRTKPAMGWVRNEGLENQELLKRLASLQGRFDQLEEETKALRKASGEIAEADLFQSLDCLYAVEFKIGNLVKLGEFELTWASMFYGIADEMLIPCSEAKLRLTMKTVLIEGVNARPELKPENWPTGGNIEIRKAITISLRSLKAITRQLMALGLVEPQHVLRQSGDETGSETTSDRCWVLTSQGRAKFLKNTAYLVTNAA